MNAASVEHGDIERYSFSERICHWLAGITYVYCLATGLAFYTPYLFWIAIALGGGPLSRSWHPIIGLVFVASSAWMHHMWRRDMSLIPPDREWLAKIRYYITNRDELVPPQWRFNAGQKQFYWVMFYGAAVLLLTGIVMWLPEHLPLQLHWLRAIVIILHECAALVTIGAFIIHVYMGLFLVPAGVRTMTVGTVTRAWAKKHHRLWYEKVTGEPQSRP